jgi:hypothetical protein
MKDGEPTIPARIVEIAKRIQPALEIDSEWTRKVEAEITPEYRPGLRSPLYDKWLELLLRSIDPEQRDKLQLIWDARDLEQRLNQSAASQGDDELHSLADEIALRLKQWETDWRLKLLDEPPSPFMRRFMLDSRKRRRAQGDTPPRPVDWDRLPQALRDFAAGAVDPSPRGSKFWNAVREFVFPHFHEDALAIEPYREFLTLLIRHYGKGETESLIPSAESLIERLKSGQAAIAHDDSRRTGIDAQLLEEKCEDLLRTIKRGGPGPKRGPAPR